MNDIQANQNDGAKNEETPYQTLTNLARGSSVAVTLAVQRISLTLLSCLGSDFILGVVDADCEDETENEDAGAAQQFQDEWEGKHGSDSKGNALPIGEGKHRLEGKQKEPPQALARDGS